jgi:hypothetical protein
MGLNPVVSIIIIALGVFLAWLIFAMERILATAPLLSPLAGVGALIMVILGVYTLVTSGKKKA